MYLNVLTLLTVFMLSNAIEETGGDVGDPCGDDNILIEHDIAIPKKEYFSHMFRKRRAVTSNQEKKWPNAIVPYTINKELNSYQHDVIKKAISHWEEHTCIRFVEHKKQQDYVEFAHGNCGCCSLVGRRGDGRQQVSLDVICTEFGIVVHEIGHVIGFWHEHNRPDRDKFVKIYAENIKHDKKDRFIKKNTLEINSYGQAYDYNSIMHYRRNTNSRNGKDTIEPRMHDVEIGQRDGLSQSDVIQARELYQCPKPACSYTLTEPEGVLKSPYFPYNYPKNHECHWVIKTPPDSKVILKFIKFDMEYTEVCGFDYLEIRLGLHSTSPLYDIYCGDELPEPVVSHSGLWMKFRSDDSIVRCGFMANYSIGKTF
ncbi:bone morphogenetic protein 1-like [Saccoglossus kowalevskii]